MQKIYNSEYSSELLCKIYYKTEEKVYNIKETDRFKIKKLFLSNKNNQLLHIFLYKIESTLVKKIILDKLKKIYHLSDNEIYNEIRFILINSGVFPNLKDPQRGQIRINSIKKYIDNLSDYNIKTYLDIGCFDGEITKAIGESFKLNKEHIFGIDIKDYDCDKTKFNFSLYDGKKIPFDNNKFDLVTILMVLHHVPLDLIDVLLLEIHRIMKPGGLLILREHNSDTNNYLNKYLLDTLHDFHDVVLNPNLDNRWTDNFIPENNNYNTEEYWSKKIINLGFTFNKEPDLVINTIKNPFNNYILSYIKI